MEAFFAMGKYAAYVWPAYGASLVGLGLAIGLTLAAYARAKSRLAALESGK
ncbi:MAG TPA: heme exporter protein CcmD [Rhizomicrobium sp.]|jgi:heme exporter protein CcmD